MQDQYPISPETSSWLTIAIPTTTKYASDKTSLVMLTLSRAFAFSVVRFGFRVRVIA